jgi:enterochelin esterase-like enzyme
LEKKLIDRIRRDGTPVREHDRAIFVWQGAQAPRLMGDFNGWEDGEALELEPAGPDLWVREVEFVSDAYIEYIFVDEAGERVLDPHNPRKTPNGMGKTNQFFYMPDGRPTSWTLRLPGIPRGELSHARLDGGNLIASGKRTVHFYQPPTDEPAPLLVVWDGGDYLQRAHLPAMLDHLIARGRIRPLALAMVENGGPARMMEYACSEATLWFTLKQVLPAAFERLNLIDPDEQPGAFGVLGASMGGLMSLYTGLRLPHIFGKVLAQSGAYNISGHEFITTTLVEHEVGHDTQIWMDVGRYEFLLEANRDMVAKLAEHGYDFDYHEYSAGHNYPAWRDDLPGGLECLFGVD